MKMGNSFIFQLNEKKKKRDKEKPPASQLRANACLFWMLNVSHDTEMG